MASPLAEIRIAVVHEWPVLYSGSERVVAAMLGTFPQAEAYAIVHDPAGLHGTPLENVTFRTSFIQALPKAKENYRSYLPLMPLAVEQQVRAIILRCLRQCLNKGRTESDVF